MDLEPQLARDPDYRPYCCACSTMARMAGIEPRLWKCACGAVHDMRPEPEDGEREIKYRQMAHDRGIVIGNDDLQAFGLRGRRDLLRRFSLDRGLNNIPLRVFDALALAFSPSPDSANRFETVLDAVCTFKQALRDLALLRGPHSGQASD